MSLLVVVTIGVHLAASLLLAAFGLHRLFLAIQYFRLVRGEVRPIPPLPSCLPSVTVQIPLYNERYVAERAVLAAAGLDYPSELLEIQILDDSSDDTSTVVAGLVQQLRAHGVDIRHLRRTDRSGFKAGALANGLAAAHGELVAIFDADFVPPRGFLRRTVGEFADTSVGMVQARWQHLNGETSVLTRLQALQLDAHFTIEHGVRAATGCFFNFNGTAGIWRRQAIESSGGWQADTLTEDLDLSYRAQLAGWRFVYRDDVGVPAEVPVEIAAYRIQQQRWAQGGIQTALNILPTLLRAGLPRRVKAEAVCHLAGHFTYPSLVALALAGLCLSFVAGSEARTWAVTVDGALLLAATLTLSVFYGTAAYARAPFGFARRLAIVPLIMLVGAGMAFGQTAAVLRGLRRFPTPFRRTPKYRLGPKRDPSWHSATYRVPATRIALVECLLGLAILTASVTQLASGVAMPTGMSILLGAGALTVGGGMLAQHRAEALVSVLAAAQSPHA